MRAIELDRVDRPRGALLEVEPVAAAHELVAHPDGHVVAQGTVEERILALQDKKRALFEAALDGEGAGAAALTRDDLLALFD